MALPHDNQCKPVEATSACTVPDVASITSEHDASTSIFPKGDAFEAATQSMLADPSELTTLSGVTSPAKSNQNKPSGAR